MHTPRQALRQCRAYDITGLAVWGAEIAGAKTTAIFSDHICSQEIHNNTRRHIVN